MRILFFINDLRSGGKERRLVELIKGLSKYPSIEMEMVLTREIIHYKDIFSTGIKIYYTKRKEGVKKDPRVFYEFYKIANKFKPNIINVWGNLVAIYALPTKIILNIPMVNNQITDAPLNLSKSLLSHKLTFPFSDRIISNTFAGLSAYQAPIKKSLVIYNGFDFKRIVNLDTEENIRKKFNIKTRYIVGMVASFSERKDYDTYINAATKILKNRRDVTFLCIGDGNSKRYSKMVPEKIKNHVLFLGKQVNVESIMNICDIGILMTNIDNHGEGISNALLEFSALGIPVIANLGGGNGELIKNDYNGFLIKSKDSKELTKKILFLLDDNVLKKKMGLNAKEIVKNKFNLNNMIKGFYEIFKSLH